MQRPRLLRTDIFEQAKSVSPVQPFFTNRGRETSVKPGKKLTRVPFKVSRLMEFCTRRELENQTGHAVYEWPLVVLKELLDNALDACEEAEIAPDVLIIVKGNSIAITDNGLGIPEKTIKDILDYNIRVSSREAYVSPTRGAQGNALKTILPMGYVLNEHRGELAQGKTIIEANGVSHHIVFDVDHIHHEPKITYRTTRSSLRRGTRFTVELPPLYESRQYETELIGDRKEQFLDLAESYTWLNPHLSLRLSWNGRCEIDLKASNPHWTKWLPSWPTSAHWYDKSRLRRYMAAHIAHRGDITVREFVSEFRGLFGTAKQKAVLAEIGASRVSLHNYFGKYKVKTDNITKLWESLKRHSKPVKPNALGIIGKEHLYRRMEAAGGDPKTFTYNRSLGETGGLPRVIEFAFGIHSEGLKNNNSDNAPSRQIITGVNWSPGIGNPFRQLGRTGHGLDGYLAEVRANTGQPVIACLHLACPRVAYTDRGKSAIVVEGDGTENDDDQD